MCKEVSVAGVEGATNRTMVRESDPQMLGEYVNVRDYATGSLGSSSGGGGRELGKVRRWSQ